MCNANCILFGAMNLREKDIEGKRVIEIGSCDINGSLRPLMESYNPAKYIGIDLVQGPCVDIVCSIRDVVDRFGEESFDVVISNEMLEHIKDWRMAIHNIKSICRKGGIILLTTRSRGVQYHGHPYDFWRYEIEDMRNIFSDCQIEKLEKDPKMGVFIKAIKPNDFIEKDLSNQALYSIVLDKRIIEIDKKEYAKRFKKISKKEKLKTLYDGIRRILIG
jgi:SAM-dependent methyltransferase